MDPSRANRVSKHYGSFVFFKIFGGEDLTFCSRPHSCCTYAVYLCFRDESIRCHAQKKVRVFLSYTTTQKMPNIVRVVD